MSVAKTLKLVIQVVTCGAALATFLMIEGIFWAILGFFATWIVGNGIAMWGFARLATPQERQDDLQSRANAPE